MVTRPEALSKIAELAYEQETAVANASRMMNDAVPPYCTVIGRGRIIRHLSIDWLISTYLATILSDPKNVAKHVPAIGDMRARESRLVSHEIMDTRGSSLTAHRTEDVGGELFRLDPMFDWPFVQRIRIVLTCIALHPNGVAHQKLRHGFKLSIQWGRSVSGEISTLFHRKSPRVESWNTTYFSPQHDSSELLSDPETIQPVLRTIEIPLTHLEVLGSLYADSLKHDRALLATLGRDIAALQAFRLRSEPPSSDGPGDETLAPERTASR